MIAMAPMTAKKITALPVRPSWLDTIDPTTLLNERPCGIKEIAQELDLGREKVVELVKNEGLPGKKIGNRWEFYITLVRAWRVDRQLKRL
jgi:excisionase family DNA binding protein